jgi:glycosyltransferase involved in cell wall biosynthesis
MTKQRRILISANHCAPGHGSEHGVGWNFVSGLAKYHHVTLITNRHVFFDKLTEEASKLGITVYGIKQYINYKGIILLLPFIYYSDYKWWQYRVYRKVKRLHREQPFDLIHQVTNITFREPGYLWRLNVPFVWGPVVALGYEWPKFLDRYGFPEGLKMILRHLSFKIRYARPGRIKKALQACRLCLPVCESTRDLLQRLSPDTRFFILPETGAIDERIAETIRKRMPDEPIRLLWISRFDASKGVMFLLEALAQLPSRVSYRLILAGDGLQRRQAIAFCEEKKIPYEYVGTLPYAEVHQLYAQVHLFFITSMKDATTSVLFEALSSGLPVVALDHLSFGEKIDASCGAKIKVETPERIACDIAAAICSFYENEPMRQAAAQGALARAEKYSWSAYIRQLHLLYDEILS